MAHPLLSLMKVASWGQIRRAPGCRGGPEAVDGATACSVVEGLAAVVDEGPVGDAEAVVVVALGEVVTC